MKPITQITLSTSDRQLISSDIAMHFQVVPKEKIDNKIYLYTTEVALSNFPTEELSLILDAEIVLIPVAEEIINKALSIHYRATTQANQNNNLSLNDDFLEQLIAEAKNTGSSDIHFEIFKDTGRVRFRIDGSLLERYQIELEDYAELVNKIKIKAKLKITEKRLPQDGRINYEEFDIRVSILPTLHGEKIVMRILGRDTSNLSIDKLGMSLGEKDEYLKAVNATKGIILISGPTGSGKTTTLYATLKLLNKTKNNILTIEDPIEYTMKGINQVQLREDIGLTFDKALKTFLRQDPDIIMLGEIRDEKTAQMAIRASLTGHLVLSTIHTNSALGTLSRLIDMGVPPFLIAETLQISVAQRLVRKLCNDCKEEDKEAYKKLKELGFETSQTLYKAVGCDYCYHTGFKGRIAIYELIPMTNKVKDIVKTNSFTSQNEQAMDYEKLAVKALKLVQQGITTIDEVYAILIEDKNNL